MVLWGILQEVHRTTVRPAHLKTELLRLRRTPFSALDSFQADVVVAVALASLSIRWRFDLLGLSLYTA